MQDHSTRRIFIVRSMAAGCALALPLASRAATHVDESDSTAVALGYRHDTHAVDQARFPHHTVQQHCALCSFWQGEPNDAWAGCAMFGRKQVANGAWCQAWHAK